MRTSSGIRFLLYAASLTTAVGLLVLWILLLLPEPLSDPIDSIGNGKPTVALVYHPTAVETSRLQKIVIEFRDRFEPRAFFIVLDAHHPQHQARLRELGVGRPAIILFSATGQRHRILEGIESVAALEQAYRNFVNLD